jgi:hypothetical protein
MLCSDINFSIGNISTSTDSVSHEAKQKRIDISKQLII